MKSRKILLNSCLWALFAVPLHQVDKWQILKYSSIKPNVVNFSKQGMKINVEESASPIILPFKNYKKVVGVEVSGELNGQLHFAKGVKQGSKGGDDFALRIGLVQRGSKTLGIFKRMVVAAWIKKLFDLAPEGSGIDRIEFLNAVAQTQILGKKRRHPLSDLLYENNVWLLDKPGKFAFKHQFKKVRDVVALWLSIDGDGTKSDYSILLQNLELQIH